MEPNATALYPMSNRIYYPLVGIKGGQDTRLNAIPIPLRHIRIQSISIDKLLQLTSRFKERLLAHCPIADILIAVGTTEDTLKSTETLIAEQLLPLFRGR
ncbi:hypothetical protein IX332_001758 [Porphyromonas levii]|nr:hypothetical protein [Porphyromonas levii]